MSLTVKAYAKINLWLDITGRRADGYHTLNTVMRRIDLYDDVTVETNGSGDITVSCISPDIPHDERNIAYRAAKLFFSEMRKNMGAYIKIVKRIPVEAGLGGSSADGAAVLTALNTLCGRPFGTDELCALGARLGADVPFCIKGGTARCTGIGDIMQSIECADLAVLVIKPEFSCSTAEAYRRYDDTPCPIKVGFDEYCGRIGHDRTYLAENMYNVFETLYGDERISAIKEKLMQSGALGACMTGSGSAVFGVFPDIEAALKASGKLDFKTKFTVNAI